MDRSLWRSAAYFEYAGPADCRVGPLCGHFDGFLVGKDQLETLGFFAQTPISLAAPGGPGCQHRLVPLSRGVGEALGMKVATDQVMAEATRRLGAARAQAGDSAGQGPAKGAAAHPDTGSDQG